MDPLSPILWVPEGKICKISPISNAYSCHCKRDASCHMTCLSVYLSVRNYISRTTRPNFSKFSVHVVCGRGLILYWQRCNMLCTSGFEVTLCFPTMALYRRRCDATAAVSLAQCPEYGRTPLLHGTTAGTKIRQVLRARGGGAK